MKKIKVIELFAGVGSQRMALRNIGVEHEVVAISEIDKFAVKSYEAIHGEVNNMGDISKIKSLPDCNFLTYSFPCTDISVAGDMKGLTKGSGTRSGLLWEVERLINDYSIRGKLPTYLMLENVKNLVTKFNDDFKLWIDFLNSMGYNSYYKVINSNEFGAAQNRERVFVISVLKEHDYGYEFPEQYSYFKTINDIKEDYIEDKYYINKVLNPVMKKNYIQYDNSGKGHSSQANRLYYTDSRMGALPHSNSGDKTQIIDFRKNEIIHIADLDIKSYGQTKRVLDSNGISHSLDTMQGGYRWSKIIEEGRPRRLTPKECWRLMTFSDEDFEKAQKVNSDSQLYKQAGNSIVVNILEGLYKQLFRHDEI